MLIEITNDPETHYMDENENVVSQKDTGEVVVRASFYDDGKESLYVKGFSSDTSLQHVIDTMEKEHTK